MSLALNIIAIALGLFLIQTVLRDAFETVILPRRPSQRRRITILYTRATWPVVRRLVRRLPAAAGEGLLNYSGPVWILGLIACWAAILIVAFALRGWGAGSHYYIAVGDPPEFLWDLYVSGTTLFTLGMGTCTRSRQPHESSRSARRASD